jgi:hypothetical protein
VTPDRDALVARVNAHQRKVAANRERALRAVVRALLPYARLYTPPEDDPDFDRSLAKQTKLIALAERLSRRK